MKKNPDKPAGYKVSPQEQAVLDVYDLSRYDYTTRRNNYICKMLEDPKVKRITMAIKFNLSIASIAAIKKRGHTDISHWPVI